MIHSMRMVIAALVLAGCGSGMRPEGDTVTLAAVGDVMLDRNAGRMLEKAGPGWPFENVKQTLAGADAGFANLESPIAVDAPKVDKPIAFRASVRAADSLAGVGFKMVSLANNHAADCGRAGILETMRALRKAGIKWCGAGRNRPEAEAPVIVKVGGVRLAFVGFTEFPEGSRKRDDVPTMALADAGTIRRSVGAARALADVVVVSLHWGEEYQDRPGEARRSLARVAAEAGADLIVGHHPHVLQGFEVINGVRRTLVAYSLGNFVFDQRTEGTREGAILLVRLNRQGVVSASVVPVRLVAGRPTPAVGEEGSAVLRSLAGLSAEMNTEMNGPGISLYRQ
jgi:poly-gamma-glutamate synthesis protein (capsule biosynthesis protein)